MLCNLLSNGKRTWRADDFLSTSPDDDDYVDPAEAAAGLAAYEAEMEETRREYEQMKAENVDVRRDDGKGLPT